MFISRKLLHTILQYLLDYDLDIAQKVLTLKEDSELKDVLKQKQLDVLDLSLYLTQKLYIPKIRKTKKID